MADFAPPTGPPPPRVPEGWKAVWNDQYKEWFYVNIYNKKSQWDKPIEPAHPPSADGAPPGPPPGYDHNSSRATGPEKGGYGGSQTGGPESDEAMARRLQEEENARSKGESTRGASDSYYGSGGAPGGPSSYGQGAAYGQGSASPYGQASGSPYGQQPGSPGRDTQQQKGGFFNKLTNKFGGGSSARPPQQSYGQGYPGPQQGGYPSQQYGGGYQQQQGGYYPPQQQGGYYPPQGGQAYAQQPQQKKQGIGMGGALLGAGAGLVGGALLMDAIDDHDQHEYDQGYDQGAAADDGGGDYGGDDGGDFGGGDF